MATHCSILAWKIHGQRRLAGCSPWGYMTEHVCSGGGGRLVGSNKVVELKKKKKRKKIYVLAHAIVRVASLKSVRQTGGLKIPAGVDCSFESSGSMEAEFLSFGSLSVFTCSFQLIKRSPPILWNIICLTQSLLLIVELFLV